MMGTRIQNKNADIVLSCVEDKIYKGEILLEHHSLVRIISGEMKVVQADHTFTVGSGDVLLFPRNQLSSIIKYPKDGRIFKSVLITLTSDRLQEFYLKNRVSLSKPSSLQIMTFDKHPLLESFFASLMPYFDLEDQLPPEIETLKITEAISVFRSIDKQVDSLLADFSDPGKINLAAFMEKNFMFNLSLEKFGYLTGRSIATFNRDFRKVFHTPPQKWLTQKRLELAHYQLTEKNRKPVDVYIEAGFENLSHFSFAFKKHFGYTPTKLTEQLSINR